MAGLRCFNDTCVDLAVVLTLATVCILVYDTFMKYFSVLFFALACIGAGCATTVAPRPVPVPIPAPVPGPVACTMEAKQCPDGSYVGRTGPKCEFTPCPTIQPSSTEGRVCSGSSDKSCGSGYECSQDCGPPVARESDPTPGYSCHIAGKPRMCPICLASNTMIATPEGEVNVKNMNSGMRVWTLNAHGDRVAGTVIRISSTSVPKMHQVVHLVLSNQRQVWVSPGHPTVSGSPVGDLRPGDAYDGATVVSVDQVPYWDDRTYDLLTDGATGAYWANGILLGSTLLR